MQNGTAALLAPGRHVVPRGRYSDWLLGLKLFRSHFPSGNGATSFSRQAFGKMSSGGCSRASLDQNSLDNMMTSMGLCGWHLCTDGATSAYSGSKFSFKVGRSFRDTKQLEWPASSIG